MKQQVEELQKIVDQTQQIIVSATTVFPFTVFPDTLTIDREKVTIVHRTFFRVNEVMSIHIDDVLNVTANVGPFFGSLEFSTRFFANDKPYKITFFWRDDALLLKDVLQGYIIARQKKMDTASVNTKELAKLLHDLGRGTPE